jgi:hypothetical protein
MPTNAESFVGSYVSSLETFWNKEREEAKTILMAEERNRGAFIQTLEMSIRAADKDILNWTKLEGTADRAERRLILERQRLSISRAKARMRGVRSGSVAGSAFDDLESKFAQKATGKGEKSLSLAKIVSRGKSDEEVAKAIVLSLQNETDLSSLIAKTGVGVTGGAGVENKAAAGSGIMRTLTERSARNRLGISKKALQMAAATMVGLHGFDAQGRPLPDHSNLLGPEMVSKMRGAVTMRADKAVAAAPSGAGDKALADELQRSGFLLEDFLPAMEATGLIQRREDLERRLAEEMSARVPDLEAETERRFLDRVGTSGAGEGLEFAGRGIIGAFQFAAQEKKERRALDERRASLTARQGELDAMTPNARLLQRTTGLAMGSFQKHGNNIPPGVDKNLWNLAGQIANQSKSGGFSSRDDIVVQARALVNQLESTKRMSPEERENALEQTLEFFGMQKMGDYPPPAPPVERVVDEVDAAVEAADPDKKRSGSSADARAAAAAKAAKDKAEREKAGAAKAKKKGPTGPLGLSSRDLEAIKRIGQADYSDAIFMKHTVGGSGRGPEKQAASESAASLRKANQGRLTSLIGNPSFGSEVVKIIQGISEDERSYGIARQDGLKSNRQSLALAKQAFLSKLLDVVESNAPGEGRNIRDTGVSLASYLSLNPADAAKPMHQIRPRITPADLLIAEEEGSWDKQIGTPELETDIGWTERQRNALEMRDKERLQAAALGFPQVSEFEMQTDLDAMFDAEESARERGAQSAQDADLLAGFTE